ncbi:TonB-dependent receptor [Flavobacterium sp. T12S277]|uniref:TonB-dependent receptor n=1 Tax=Flavobacterium sp. T12S277 TaxID=3402752 RepID=UPI003AECC4B5
MKIIKKITIAAFAMHSVLSIAQKVKNDTIKKITQLNEVEVTATSATNKSLLSQPQSISILGEKELKRGTGLFLDDALNTNVPGVFMQRRTVSAGQTFNIRGYGNGTRGTNGSNSNFDTQGTKIYLNNIPVTDAEGITLMDDLDFSNIGNVEVLKGPAGSLYGLAISGVVNLKTIAPEAGKSSISQNTLFGSNGLQRFTTELQLGGEKSSFLLNYGKQKYDGFMNHTASHKDFVNSFADFKVNNKQKINAYLGYSNSYDQRNGELSIAQYNNFDYSGNPAYIKNDAHSNVISFRAGVNHTYQFCKNFSNSTTLFGTGVSSNVSSAGGWTDKLSVNYGLRSTFDTNFELNEKIKLSGITGIEMQQQNAQTIGYNMTGKTSNTNDYNIIAATKSNVYVISKTSSLFTEWTLSLPKDFSVTAGIGSSYMGVESKDRFPYTLTSPNNPGVLPTYNNNASPANYQVAYKNMISPKFAINKIFDNNVSVYASYNKGYKAPTSAYLFIPANNSVNTNLCPEVANQFEIGSKGKLIDNRLYYEVAAFQTKFTDKMTNVAVPNATNTATLYSYVVNAGDQNHKGIEALLKYQAIKSKDGFIRSIVPFVNATYSDFKYDNYIFQTAYNRSYDFSGRSVLGAPKWVVNSGVDFVTKYGFYGNATYSYRDKMNFAYVPEVKTSSNIEVSTAKNYGLLNAKLGFQKNIISNLALDVYAGITNATKTQYAQMIFVNQLPDAYLAANPNATFFGGLNLKYTF